ncbi:hypothetical protein M9Y10_023839 [Tritrichomonas musculus]|uniref:Surface antigen BspA-like n=1 Tax=Tritrichomonas musculus TaxID=1915356 RepID=A0ABR2KW89_9EUKA
MHSIKLQHILISPNSQLQIIGERAFAFTQIRSISIPAHVTHIYNGAFSKCSCLKHVEIPINSKLQKIEINAFSETEIESIFIPESLIDLEEGWCSVAPKLTTIEIDAKNPRYSYIENQFLVGKSDNKSEDYDSLLFARHDITKVKIPPFIKTIQKYVFSYNQQLQQVEIPLNSKLQTIDKEAFSYTSIERFSIPVHFTKIGEGAFAFCEKLRRIEIPQNSELQIIDAFAFFGSALESILIPAHVTCITFSLLWVINYFFCLG